jgi:hypothetical protein
MVVIGYPGAWSGALRSGASEDSANLRCIRQPRLRLVSWNGCWCLVGMDGGVTGVTRARAG